jgi:hypothetical protein
MSQRIRSIHAELRSALGARKNALRWSALLEVAREALRDEALVAQLAEEVWPALEQELDRSWPALVRVVTPLDPPLIRTLGRTLHLQIDWQTTQALGAALGLKLAVPLNKRTIRELAPRWLDGARWQGLILSSVAREHEALMQGLLDAGLADLKHLRLHSISGEQAQLHAMMRLALAAFGQTLESFGALGKNGDHDPVWAALYTPLYDRLDALPALDHLGFPPAPRDGPDPFARFMAHPALDRLSAIGSSEPLSAQRVEILTQRAASSALRRVMVSRRSDDDEALRALMRAPNLASVEAWDIQPGYTDLHHERWDSPEVDRWRDELKGTPRTAHALDAAEVDLSALDRAQTVAALFDGEQLRGSPRLESLQIARLGGAWMLRMAEQAHEAWPNLHSLRTAGEALDAPTFEAWARSPRAPALRRFEVSSCSGWPHDAIRGSRAVEATTLARCLDLTLPPALARHLLESTMQTSGAKPHALRMARALGVPSPADEPLAIQRQCRAHLDAINPLPRGET